MQAGVGTRHEHNNHADPMYVQFVEIATKLLSQHHANVHSGEGTVDSYRGPSGHDDRNTRPLRALGTTH